MLRFLNIFSFCILILNDSFGQNYELNITYNIATEGYTGSHVVDINQDGFPDILYADRRDIFLFLNKGNGKMEFDKILLHKDQSPIKTFDVWDLDNDGDLDILVGVTSRIIQIENKSTLEKPDFFKVFKDVYFQGVQNNAVPVFAVDYINVDSLYDIVTTFGKSRVLYQKPDNTFFEYEIPNAAYSDIQKIKVADLRNEGKSDLIFSRNSKDDEAGLMYILNANNTFSAQNVLLNGSVKYFETSDLNGDGQNDILAIGNNEKAELVIFTYQAGDTLLYQKDSFDLADLSMYSSFIFRQNENGIHDIIAASDQKKELLRYRFQISNDQISWEKSHIHPSEFFTKQIFMTDLNGDGLDDIIQMLNDNGFNIYQQKIFSNTDDISLVTKVFPNPVSNDLIVESSEIINKVCLKNIYGQKVKILENINNNTIQISLADQQNGYYILEVNTANNKIQYKPIILTK